ncbi:MAG TPA: extracellular solute-binding protein [Gemmatimonadaceae bacterium]|nr:extracellular solute-binding protein [Gemmatimonadaceae bacterium]
MRRRTFIKATAATLGTSAFGFPFISRTHAQLNVDRSQLTKTLRFSSYGGTWQAALTDAAIKPFEAKYGVQVLQDSHASEAALIAKMKASGPGSYDIVTVNESGLYLGVKQGVFEELRLANIPNYANVVKVLQKPAYDPGPGVHSVPDVYGSSAVVYNTQHVTKPTGWDVLWDPKYKGRICVRDSAIYRVFITALYLRQNPNQISDIDKIYAALKAQRPLVLKYWGGTSEMQTLVANQEVWAGDFVGGRTVQLKEQGVPVDYLVPEAGARGFVDCVGLGVGSPNRYTAEVFLNYLLDPEVATKLAELTKYPNCLDPSKVPTSAVVKSFPEYDPSGTLSRFIFTDYDYMEKNRQAWEAEWTKIKLGG